ncbi:hypothetical protein [Paramicrobacterium agarici]|uniref:hypothetical protein n=1 Tax=Paramicrobacterium agarici TaxID=630514 RepID=UPI00114E6A6D|nr:hypothetical protein [Microbacterium agarici]TQO24097.1 hypothetical protein FB385_2967 [Microbacterium agarici]
MNARAGAIAMAVVLVLYLVLVGQRAVQFVLTGEPIAVAIGVALIVLPLVGVWGLAKELQFGVKSGRLATELDDAGEMPDDLPVLPSGRIDRAAADAAFPAYRARAETEPENWRAWFRLGLVYRGAGDSRRARAAVRRAIRLHDAETKRAGR